MRYLLLAVLLLFIDSAFAQSDIPLGTWRTHFSYNSAKHVTIGGDKIYVASENGLFVLDTDDNSLTTISKIDGLQEDNISTLFFDEVRNQLIIGYTSGNIDVIAGNEIINFDLVTNSQVLGSKKINQIIALNGRAYISTDYGLLNFDLIKLEVKETYRQLGNVANQIKVNQSTILGDSIFLATEEGVIASNIVNGTNLFDPVGWRRYTLSDGLPTSTATIIQTLDDKVVAGFNSNGLYNYTSGNWLQSQALKDESFLTAFSDGTQMVILTLSEIYTLDNTENAIAITDNLITTPTDALVSGSALWLTDKNNGLVTNYQGAFESIKPSGPNSNALFRFFYHNNSVTGLSGGYSTNRIALSNGVGFYQFMSGTWTNFNEANVTIPQFDDIVDAGFDAKTNAFYYASFGFGLMKIDDQGVITIIDENTSPLINLTPGQRGVNLTAVESSNEGLWVLNYGAGQGLHLLSENEWKSYTLNTSALLDIENTQSKLWMIVDPLVGGGILVFDKAAEQTRYLTSQSGNGGLPSDNVNTLATDKEGFIWVGTNAGVAVFSNVIDIQSSLIDAIIPIFENRQLLRDEEITAIKVDAGNRKWIGTRNGVWLFDEQADRQLLNFNIDNSPLPSNNITAININEVSGEVFFATPEGIISYRGNATMPAIDHGQVKIFPNPVPRDFNGTIGINGLVEDADLKITDVSGKLIWATRSEGGTATWDARDYNGNRAATGIYFVFSSSQDGDETFIGKIAVIN
jgi:ligand-binding sensor domain-containing protein